MRQQAPGAWGSQPSQQGCLLVQLQMLGGWWGQERAGGRGSPLRGGLRSGEVRPAAWLGGHQGPEPEAG